MGGGWEVRDCMINGAFLQEKLQMMDSFYLSLFFFQNKKKLEKDEDGQVVFL